MTEGAHFTIDFIEQQHRQPVQTLMEILCIDMKQAYQLYIESGFNTQAAIHLKTNPSPQKNHFQNSHSINTRGRSRRNGIVHDYQGQMAQIYDHFDPEAQFIQEFQSLPIARGRRPDRVPEETEFDVKFNKLLEAKKKKKSFQHNYPVRRLITAGEPRSIGMQIFEKKPNKQSKKQSKKLFDLRPFFKEIEKELIKKQIPIKFGRGSMSQELQRCLMKFQPLLAFHISFDREENPNSNTKNASKKPFKPRKMVIDITDDNDPDEKMVEFDASKDSDETIYSKSEKNSFLRNLLISDSFGKMANECFFSYIFDPQNYDMEPYFKSYFQKATKKQSYLAVLRVNYMQEMELMGKISLDEVVEKVKSKDEKEVEQEIGNLIGQLKKLSQKCKSIQNQEDKLIERYNLFREGIYHYDYRKPPSTAQKIKIKEDRQIIKQQEEEFMNMQHEFIEQQIRQTENQGSQKQKVSKEDIMAKRAAVRERLTKYSEGECDVMMVKLRLPSGKNIIVQVSMKEKVEYLFDYIFSHEMESLGFEQEEEGGCCEREFDIIRPEDKLSLETKLGTCLEEVFEGSTMESVIVKQKS